MKKLKRFVINSARSLSQEEMASITGTDIVLVDKCEEAGQSCILNVVGNTVTVGVCRRNTSIDSNGNIVVTYDCV